MHAVLAEPVLLGLFQFDEPLGLLFAAVLIATSIVMLFCVLGTPGESNIATMVLLLCLVGTLLVTTTHLFLLYVFWEITAFSAWGVGRLTTRGSDAVLGPLPWQGAGGLGSISMFGAVLFLISESRTADLIALNTANPLPVAALIALGAILKSMSLFSHAWHDGLPYTASVSSGLLAGGGVLLTGIYPLIRLSLALPTDIGYWRTIIPLIAVPVALIAGLAALGGRDLPSIVSYVALNQWALLMLGIANVDQATLITTLLQSITYAAGILLLFVCVGRVVAGSQERDLRYLGGLARAMPLTAVLFFLAALALVGVPPFSSFLSRQLAAASLQIPDLLTRSMLELLAVLALVRAFYRTFLGTPAGEAVETLGEQRHLREVSWLGAAIVAGCLAGLIWITLNPQLLIQLITTIAARWRA